MFKNIVHVEFKYRGTKSMQSNLNMVSAYAICAPLLFAYNLLQFYYIISTALFLQYLSSSILKETLQMEGIICSIN